MAGTESRREPYRIDDPVVDVGAVAVWRGTERLVVPDLSFSTLVLLIRRAPDVVSHQELVDEVCSGMAISDENISQRIALLRRGPSATIRVSHDTCARCGVAAISSFRRHCPRVRLRHGLRGRRAVESAWSQERWLRSAYSWRSCERRHHRRSREPAHSAARFRILGECGQGMEVPG